MNDLDIINAYDTATLAAEAFFQAGEKAINTKAELEAARLEALMTGVIVGKNADEREANAREALKPLFDKLAVYQEQERKARYDFDQAMRHIEKVRSLLRLLEITSKI